MISESVENVPQREYNINVCFYYLEVNMSFATTTEMAENGAFLEEELLVCVVKEE